MPARRRRRSVTRYGSDVVRAGAPTPYVARGHWRRVCMWTCDTCARTEFLHCTVHPTQQYARVARVWTPQAATANAEEEPDGRDSFTTVMGCVACDEKRHSGNTHALECSKCAQPSMRAVPVMLEHAQLAVLRVALMRHQLVTLIEGAVVRCDGCAAMEFPLSCGERRAPTALQGDHKPP